MVLALSMFTGETTRRLQKAGEVWLKVKDYGIETKTGEALSFYIEAYLLCSLINHGNNYRY